ncbi:MAG: hypothetical protein OJF59_002410 [Cytophagales bacterium]|jgi:hypothetical protein|nr:hypothetical protein [Bacteroidota bacterium]MBS1980145.1 hypothetical protein [Bacteroidota bacterium]WHZ08656.1 MAG: hypothetical protein OJF59_002410 [Cytophagales bacterium]
MKTIIALKPKMLGLFLTGTLTAFSMIAFGQTTKTVKGEILDMSCYMASGASGKGHKSCAMGCLEKGLPAGILGSDGQVYLLLEDHKKADAYKEAIKHASDNVEITGKVFTKNGVQSLIVTEIKTN